MDPCTFCKGPETPQGRWLRGSWRPEKGVVRKLAASTAVAAAAAATNSKTSSGAQCSRTCVGIRARASSAADSTHPLRDPGTLLLQGWEVAGNSKPSQPPPAAPAGWSDAANIFHNGSFASCCGLLRFSKMTYD